ncbi:MAG: tRNA uridine-5-carboxymethylaminomethyl(34) synthesis enzyme MnmG [bacterium]
MVYEKSYDIIVIGAGHAGCEAALASAKMGCATLLLTINLDSIALLPCNCSIGGPAKAHLVREIDALGGEMGRNIDKSFTHIRMLNLSKGPAVQALRAQVDKKYYQMEMKHTLESQDRLDIKQAMVEEILCDETAVTGVRVQTGIEYRSRAVIVAAGTFLEGLIHIGETSFPAGRGGEVPSIGLAQNLKYLGFNLGRLKTGTPPRIDARTIDFSQGKIQESEDVPLPFSYTTGPISGRGRLSCWLMETNEQTHRIIRDNLHRSPLFSGRIKGTGPRYCPSIEDKVVRFPDKERHQIFLEREGWKTSEVYLQGLSSSLPEDVQIAAVHSVKGLEKAELMRPGYAIEYDFLLPVQLFPTLETKLIKGLYTAGQINGTSGYEEAAAQGIMAGINAAAAIKELPPLILLRSEAYIGVLVDDLVTKGTEEPYRMLTSRAEYRLILRQGNADLRLTEKGYRYGLIPEDRYQRFVIRREMIELETARLKETRLRPTGQVQRLLRDLGSERLGKAVSLADILKRPDMTYRRTATLDKDRPSLPPDVISETETEIKYEGYIEKQQQQVVQYQRLESRLVPEEIDYDAIPSLSREGREKLKNIRPVSVGQASRIAGLTPADITILIVYLEQQRLQALRQREKTS